MKIETTDKILNRTTDILKSKNNKNPIVFSICAILGICLGMVCETINCEVYSTIGVNYDDYLSSILNSSFISIFINFFLINGIFLLFSMFSGLCAVGDKLLYALPFIKGLGIGCVSGYLYSEYSLKGVLYSSIIVIPASVSVLLAIILSCSESCLMSKDILSLISQKETENAEVNTKFYILRYGVILIILIFSAVIYAAMCRLFSTIVS